MSTVNDDMLEAIQAEAVERHRAYTWFDDIPVLLYREHDIESEVNKALYMGGMADGPGAGSKYGAAAIVHPPVLSTPEKNPLGPLVDVVLSIEYIENVLINGSADGIGKSAERMAHRGLGLLHHYHPSGLSLANSSWYADRQPLKPAVYGDDTGLRGYVIYIRIPQGICIEPKLAAPSKSVSDLGGGSYEITLTQATADSIYYTTDESLPRPGGAGSTLYSGAVTIASPYVFRAAAYKAGSAPSDTVMHFED